MRGGEGEEEKGGEEKGKATPIHMVSFTPTI